MHTRQWAIVFFLFAFLLLPGIDHGIWRPDEPLVAGICSEMARSGDYIVPHLNGTPFLEKPPLYYAVAAFAGKVFGVDWDVPYRLVSLLFGALTILITFFMVSGKHGPVAGVMASAILASAWEFFWLSRWIQIDSALVFGVTLAMYAYLKLKETRMLRDALLLGLALGIAFMAKGLVGPAIVAAAILADILAKRDLRFILAIRPGAVVLFFLVPVCIWVISLRQRGGWLFVREVIVVNNLMRFTGAAEGAALGHQHGLLYYFEHFPLDFLPWTLLFIPAIIASVKQMRLDPYMSWFLGPFILLLMASTKRAIYLVPLYPAAACMIAQYLKEGITAKWETVLLKITWFIALAGVFVPFAGAFLGFPILGISMGMISLGGLFLIMRTPELRKTGLALPLVMCLALSASTVVYYKYLQPQEDYLSFAREVVAEHPGEITILAPEEIFEGVLPFVSGKTYRVVSNPSEIHREGVYIWTDKQDKILGVIRQSAEVAMLREQRIGNKMARLAHIIPGRQGQG